MVLWLRLVERLPCEQQVAGSNPVSTFIIMIDIKWEPSEKQFKAFSVLSDKKNTEILYGGAAGGGKTYLGCVWLIISCIQYPGSRWLMGRAVLKTLKQTTLLTFFDICRSWGFREGVDYKYNSIDGVITWNNSSEIYLKDLYQYPKDMEFDSLGSTEYTGAFVDEGSEIATKAKNIVMTRIRYKLDEFGVVPKLLITSNPYKNFMYQEFYKPYKERKLKPYRCFIPALVTDNPHISKYYIENLKKTDKVTQERLLLGNWDYDSNPAKLFDYENILNMFTNSFISDGEMYITCDVARKGSDKCVIYLWSGFRVIKAFTYDTSLTNQIKDTIKEVSEQYGVPRSHIVIDEDGVGGGVVDELPGCRGFVNNSKALGGQNYINLKAQCYFKLADMVGLNQIYFGIEDPDMTDRLKEDLEQIKQKNKDKDGKLALIGKDVMKHNLGRSPDYSDALMMRMIFEVEPQEEFHTGKSLSVNF